MHPLNAVMEKLAGLKKSDQRWLLKRLRQRSPELARRLASGEPVKTEKATPAPLWLEALHQEPVTLIAAVLHGQEESLRRKFLQKSPQATAIASALEQPLKPKTRRLLASLWLERQEADFESLLEPAND